MQLSVKSNIKDVQREWKRLATNYKKAVVSGINKAAYKIAVEDMPGIMERGVDRPVSFTRRRPAYYRRARINDLRAYVGIKDVQAGYLQSMIFGGRVRPGKMVPVKIKKGKFGNIPSLRGGRKIQALLARKDTFRHTIGGVDGIWQRKRSGLELLIAYGKGTTYRKQFDWFGAVRRRADIQLPKAITVSIDKVILGSR